MAHLPSTGFRGILTAIGVCPTVTIRPSARVLGVSVALSEAVVHWREFLDSLVARGMPGEFVVSDDHAGLGAARRAALPGAVAACAIWPMPSKPDRPRFNRCAARPFAARTSSALRTTNGIAKSRRRTRKIGLPRLVDSLMRVAAGLLVEVDEEWLTGKAYVKWEREDD